MSHKVRIPLPRDAAPWCVALLAGAVGIAATYYAFANDWLIASGDAATHLNIARRLLDSKTPGLAQLGTVWLPAPHLLLQPLIYVDALWHTGLAAGLVGIVCLVVTCVAAFTAARQLADRGAAGWLAVAVLLSNPNFLYAHTTAFAEPVLLAALTVCSAFLLRWGKRQSYGDLIAAGFAAAFAVGTRYDGWFFTLVAGVLVWWVAYWWRRDLAQAQACLITFAIPPANAAFLWFLYNLLVSGDWLAFQTSAYSSPAEQSALAGAALVMTKSDLGLTFQTLNAAIVHNSGWLVALLFLFGLGVHAVRNRSRVESLVAYALLAPYPLHLLALWLGQTVIFLPEQYPFAYLNVRYGLVLLPAMAVFASGLYAWGAVRGWGAPAAAALVALIVAQAIAWMPEAPFSAALIAEGLNDRERQAQQVHAAAFLQTHYTGGDILVDDVMLPVLVTRAGIPMRNYTALSNGALWRAALARPAESAAWIVMQTDEKYEYRMTLVCGAGCSKTVPATMAAQKDHVAEWLQASPDLAGAYDLAFDENGLRVYRRKNSQDLTRP